MKEPLNLFLREFELKGRGRGLFVVDHKAIARYPLVAKTLYKLSGHLFTDEELLRLAKRHAEHLLRALLGHRPMEALIFQNSLDRVIKLSSEIQRLEKDEASR